MYADHDIDEDYWRDKQPWLLSCGYQLRPRFRKGWVPSWITSPPSNLVGELRREDYIMLFKFAAIDAVRVEDGKPLMLKRTFKYASNGEETKITAYFSSPALRKDPRNHCVPLIDILAIPGEENFEILVLPLLRPFDSPRFDTVGECVDLFQQIFQGLQFIHQHHVAHRDCSGWNLLMDATEMFPQGWHPARPEKNREYTGSAKYYTRTLRPPKYYWIDFGLSLQFDENDSTPKAIPMNGNDRTVPEFRNTNYQSTPHDPFPTDIYYLGNLVRAYFTEGEELQRGAKLGFEFMKPLVDDMVQEDPDKRPTIDECVARLDEIVSSLSSWKLRSQVHDTRDNIFGYLYRFFPFWVHRISYVIRGIPPVPTRRDDAHYPGSIGSHARLL